MSLTATPFFEPPAGKTNPWPFPVALLLHGLLLLALIYGTAVHPILAPPVTPISVQVLSEQQYLAATAPAPPPAVAAPKALPSLPPAPPPITAEPQVPQTAAIEPAPSIPSVTPGPPPGMTRATTLFSAIVLQEAASQGVRKTLTTLAPYERVTQLCNLEALEQVRRLPGAAHKVDSISASPFAETNLVNGTLTAPGAAFRSQRKWYEMQFTCTVRPDLEGVTDFQFKVGAAIPADQWDSHNLIAADAAE